MRPTTFWLLISSVLSIGQNDQVQESCQEIVSKTLLLLEETEGNVVTFASPDDYLKINQEKRRDYKRSERQEDHRYDMDKLVAAQIPKDVLDCAKRGHAQSIKLAADLSLYGLYGVPINATFSFFLIQSLTELADNEEPKDLVNGPEKTIIVPPLTGFSKNGPYLAQAYRQLGLLYATGMGIKRDYAHALVYTSLAALEGDLIAHQMMGYWYHSGIGVSRNCAKAAWHYQRVADVLNDISEDDPAGSKRWPKSVFALDKDGLYGVGASGSGNPAIYKKENHISEADLLLVYKLQADAGDAASQFMLGQSYYLGNSATSINYKKAIYYLTKSAAQYPAQIELDGEDDEYKTMALAASNAAGYLGIIYARGEGVEANLDIARQWFERGVQQDNALSHTWLGRMYLRGIGVSKDYDKALHLLNEASAKGDGDGKALLAEELLRKKVKDYSKIVTLLESAVKKSSMLGYYHLARLYANGFPGSGPKCSTALKYVKYFVERSSWHDDDLLRGEEAYKRGLYQNSLVYYISAAERGHQTAQINAAILLDSGKASPENIFTNETTAYEAALPLYLRAANQGNLDARVRVGDLYYYGYAYANSSEKQIVESSSKVFEKGQSIYSQIPLFIGRLLNKGLDTRPNYTMAFAHYSAAAEGEFTHSSIAMFNLGWMYENGLGVEQDYHLAKRWYDLALTTNPGSFLPVHIATSVLSIKCTVSDILSFMRRLFSFQSGRLPNNLRRKAAPLPGQPIMEDDKSLDMEGIDFEAAAIAFLCFVVCILFYYRTGVLARVAVQDITTVETTQVVGNDQMEGVVDEVVDDIPPENNPVDPNEIPDST